MKIQNMQPWKRTLSFNDMKRSFKDQMKEDYQERIILILVLQAFVQT